MYTHTYTHTHTRHICKVPDLSQRWARLISTSAVAARRTVLSASSFVQQPRVASNREIRRDDVIVAAVGAISYYNNIYQLIIIISKLFE